MKKFLFVYVFICSSAFCFCQSSLSFAPITDTVEVASYEEGINLVFGLIPNNHINTGYLLNKVSFPAKFTFANGLLNDSSFNMLEFYYLTSVIAKSAINSAVGPNYLKIDSLKNNYIESNGKLPWGIINIKAQAIRDSAFYEGLMGIQNHRIVELSTNTLSMYCNVNLFCSTPLNLEVFTLHPTFVIRSEDIITNNPSSIASIYVDLDDGIGWREIFLNSDFSTTYFQEGFKNYLTKVIYSNGEVFIGRSELNVIDGDAMYKASSQYKPADECYTVGSKTQLDALNLANAFGLIDKKYYESEMSQLSFHDTYPDRFSPPMDEKKYAEICIWYGCGNVAKKLRKPFIIFGGYNPKNGKSLVANNYAPWINNTFGPIFSLAGWRGPLYETYNGFFTDASKNANGGMSFGGNGNNFLDQLRQEDYDIVLVRFVDGIGFIQNNAYIAAEVINKINKQILDESEGVTNPGAAPDPEAPGYPNTAVLKKAKHELVIGGYSAGALTTRMALLLMEFRHKNDPCNPIRPVHRTSKWVAVDCENQGSNVPIGFQMFADFQRSIAYAPANLADIINSLLAKSTVDIINTNGIATQNTLYHLQTLSDIGNNTWKVGHHNDFTQYFGNLVGITPSGHPANLTGYPKDCYRIAVSQGSANFKQQKLASNMLLLKNESPTALCVNFFLGRTFGTLLTSYRYAESRVVTSWNNNAFSCKFGFSIYTFGYSFHVNTGHWKYHKDNFILDQDLPSYQNYDEAPASTLPTHILLASRLPLSSKTLLGASLTFCNYVNWNEFQVGFAPTVSGLDIHTPGKNMLPRLPELTFAPGDSTGGMNLVKQNNYSATGAPQNNSPHRDFGYPHLSFPNNHYDITPFDAIWAHGENFNSINYDDNTMHVEDPSPFIGEFLVEEIAPKTLFLSNRTIQGEVMQCNGTTVTKKYYADFEARNSVLLGNNSIYTHESNVNVPDPSGWSSRKQCEQGDFVLNNGSVVTIRANNGNGTSSITLGAGFSAKAGSIFRAYVFTDTNLCQQFGSKGQTNSTNENSVQQTKSRPVLRSSQIESNLAQAKTKNDYPPSFHIYPNPSNEKIFVSSSTPTFYKFEVRDISGRLLLTGASSSEEKGIDISNLTQGVYFLTLLGSNTKQTEQIIIE